MIPAYTPTITQSSPSEVLELKTLAQLDDLKRTTSDRALCLLFYADWHEPCHVLLE